jgi:hypothetical protein
MFQHREKEQRASKNMVAFAALENRYGGPEERNSF